MMKRFLANRRGTTAVEYAVIAGLICLVIVAAIAPIGEALSGMFGDVEAGFVG